MLMPSIFSRDFMDDLFDMPQRTYAKSYSANGLMKTDIKESEEGFTVEMDLPGFCREDISAELKDGYLTVTATAKKAEENTSDKKEKYVQKERFHATCNRSFYVGDNMKQEDIKAKFENGVLTLQVPKKRRDSGGADQEVYYDWLIINANFPYERLQGGGVNEDEAGLL